MPSPVISQSNALLNKAQCICLEYYANGAFEHLLSIQSESELKAAISDCGDGLLRFLITELSSTEDCDSIETAIGRVSAAIDDLEAVHRNLNSHLVH